MEYDQSNLKTLVELIRNKQPNIVYVHHQSDAHQDHRTTFPLVNESLGRASAPLFQDYKGPPWSIETVLAYEVWTPLPDFEYVEVISEFIAKKTAALKKHESQTKIIRYDNASEGLARYRRTMTGKGKYCEVFKIIDIQSSIDAIFSRALNQHSAHQTGKRTRILRFKEITD